jgi:uncharacterized protein YndB with AHSA1/START domain
VSVRVAVPRAAAFAIFTEEIDRWWRRGRKFRHAGDRRGIIRIEPGVGGRLFESFDSDSGTVVFETGRVVAWEPPARFALEWRNSNFAPHEKTLVQVAFDEANGDDGEGTLVTVRHSGWEALPDDHPARHGKVGAAFARMIGMWWADLLTSLRELAEDQ